MRLPGVLDVFEMQVTLPNAPTTDHLLRTTNFVPRTSQVTLPMLEAQ